MKNYINKNRLKELFEQLVSLDSLSFQERRAADFVKDYLAQLGIESDEDEAWRKYFTVHTDESGKQYARTIDGEATALDPRLFAGNVYAFVPGEGEPLLLSAHLDTVAPGAGKQAVLQGDRYAANGNAVLGSDDMSGVAQILEAVRLLKEQQIAHRPLELVFPIAEEVYGHGSREIEYERLQAKQGYVLDLSGSVGTAALQAPSLISFKLRIHGRAAHAGFAPHEGIHAIAVAARAIERLGLGQIDAQSTRNIGLISGGSGKNIIPELVTLEGEIRSYSHETALALLTETQELFQNVAQQAGATVELEYFVGVEAYQLDEDAPVVQSFQAACARLGIETQCVSTFGGSDNNHFAKHGIEGIVLSCGMQQVHTTQEFILLQDLFDGAALVLELVRTEKA